MEPAGEQTRIAQIQDKGAESVFEHWFEPCTFVK
jgi:hypothetical protein